MLLNIVKHQIINQPIFPFFKKVHPFQKDFLNALPNMTDWGKIILTLMFWKYLCISLSTEMDPLMTMNHCMNRDCTCKMQIKPRHLMPWFYLHHACNILCIDCKVTIFTCRNSRYHDTLFYKWDTLTLAITNITHRLPLSQCRLWSKYNIFLQLIKSVITSFILKWLDSQPSKSGVHISVIVICIRTFIFNFHILINVDVALSSWLFV